VALVSGANRGIGREVAKQLATRGYSVILTARDEAKARAAADDLRDSTGGEVTPLPDFAAIQAALETNFFGAYRLSVALLPLLRASEHPRIVSVSSGMGGITEMGGWTPGYRVSKASLNAMTRILATELAGDGFLVNSACPGFVKTDMGSQFGAKKRVEDGAAGVVWLATLPDDGPTGGFFRDGKPIAF
jgi:NAD(P)-dependent dehydrogenase (short-subunit alcohol dehydrogenase family)